MNLREKFGKLRKEGRIAFMPYVCVGDPDAESSVKIAEALIHSGADVLELGLPFSDPIADGPTIQRASQRALEGSMNTDKYFRVCKKVVLNSNILLVSMTYYNLVLQYGVEKYARACAESGVSGLIIPDLPFEECRVVEKACERENVDLIQLVALTTDDHRLDEIIKHAHGFIYLVSILGVTGARKDLSEEVSVVLKKLKDRTKLPVCLGFGISTKEHVLFAKKLGFSGVIVGSALIDVIEKNLCKKEKMLEELSILSGKLKEGT